MHRRIGKIQMPTLVNCEPGEITEAAGKLLEPCPGRKDTRGSGSGVPTLSSAFSVNTVKSWVRTRTPLV